MRLMACSGAPVDESDAPEILRAGWSAASPSLQRVLCADDWFHVVVGPLGTGDELASMARVCVTAGADVSCELRLPRGSVDAAQRPLLMEGFELLVDAVGAQMGLFVSGIDDLAELLDSELDVDEALELVTEWTLQYGLVLGVLLLGSGSAAAVKPDGRIVRVDAAPGGRDVWARRDLEAMSLIDAYYANPSDLEGCLASALAPATAAPAATCA